MTPLPSKISTAEVAAVELLDGYFRRLNEWTKQREAWQIVSGRADAYNDLAFLFEQALLLATHRPFEATRVMELVASLVYERGTRARKPEWCSTDEEKQDAYYAARQSALAVLQARFRDCGVPWP